jgi:hypothetical protein
MRRLDALVFQTPLRGWRGFIYLCIILGFSSPKKILGAKMLRLASFYLRPRPSVARPLLGQLKQHKLGLSASASTFSSDASSEGPAASDDHEPFLGRAASSDASLWRHPNIVRKVWRVELPAELKPNVVDPPDELRGLPHIAVMGRSNSGKSSCLNRLFGKGSQNRAKSSSRHGKTTGIEVQTTCSNFTKSSQRTGIVEGLQLYILWARDAMHPHAKLPTRP